MISKQGAPLPHGRHSKISIPSVPSRIDTCNAANDVKIVKLHMIAVACMLPPAPPPAEEPPAVGKKGGAGLAGEDSLAEPLAQSEELGQV